MIKYIASSKKQTYIYEDNNKIIVKQEISRVINDLCLTRLFSYDGYVVAIKKFFHKHAMVPLFLDNNHQFIPLNNDQPVDKIWLNYCAIKSIKPDKIGSVITFNDEQKIYSTKTINYFNKQIALLAQIQKIKNKT